MFIHIYKFFFLFIIIYIFVVAFSFRLFYFRNYQKTNILVKLINFPWNVTARAMNHRYICIKFVVGTGFSCLWNKTVQTLVKTTIGGSYVLITNAQKSTRSCWHTNNNNNNKSSNNNNNITIILCLLCGASTWRPGGSRLHTHIRNNIWLYDELRPTPPTSFSPDIN